MSILVFYTSTKQVGTKATKYKSQLKSNLDQTAADTSCRGSAQVFACSIIGIVFQLIHVVYCGEEKSIGELMVHSTTTT